VNAAVELAQGGKVDVDHAIPVKSIVDELMQRIAAHPERGRRLQVVEQASDTDLARHYRTSAALLFPSAGEGFGLPLIEAAHCNLPIIAADIPVFREIAGAHATYFPLTDARELADAIIAWLHTDPADAARQSGSIAALTWEQSAEQLLDVVLANRWYRRLRGGEFVVDARTEENG
jgi:glycosyltransferase involved in cell wall biosynthesis